MIHHVSLPAKDPKFVAETLAKILGGEAMPFPVITGAWIAWASDGVTEVEVIASGQGYRPNTEVGKEPQVVSTNSADAPTSWHLAISTDVPAGDVVRIAREAGWQAEVCDRAGFFSLVEVWIDGNVMIEVFDPKMIARYNETFTAKTWKAMLHETSLAAQGTDVIEQLRGRFSEQEG
jgi:hypothetical protein